MINLVKSSKEWLEGIYAPLSRNNVKGSLQYTLQLNWKFFVWNQHTLIEWFNAINFLTKSYTFFLNIYIVFL